MKKIAIYISLMVISIQAIMTQTVVKMNLAQQAKEALKVVVLFDEEVPGGMTVVLGLTGYQLNGGMSPYTYEWYQNSKLIGTGDIVSLVPANGDQVTLKVKDKSRCYSQSSINMKVRGLKQDGTDDISGGISVFPTFVTNQQIQIKLPVLKPDDEALIRFMDLNAKVLITKNIKESRTIHFDLPPGSYFVSVRTNEFQLVKKIVVNN